MTIYRGVGGGGNATTDSEIALLTQLEQSATAKAAEAAASALVAEGHADDAADSATAANASKIAAASSASSASSSATSASNSASSASTSASNAASSEAAAALSETAAETAQGLAEDAQTAAEIAQGLAEDAQAAAEAAQAATEDIFTQFGDQYLGAFATDPTVDNSGNALTTGDIYFNTTDNVLKFYSGAAWVAPEDVATTAATEAAASALEASGYADDASGFADAASASASAAANSASAASTSASNAATSESNAASSASSAATSASNAATSETNAAASASSASTSASNAATSETNAASSASTATTQAGIATTQAGNAATSASAAATSEANAATSATNAATSAQEAADSATAAATFDPANFVEVAGDTMTGNLTLQSNLNFSGNARRITGDFSNATDANRISFQTSTANNGTRINIISNGTGTASSLDVFAFSDPANSPVMRIRQSFVESQVQATITGTGTYQPMTFYTGGSERVRIDTSGNVGIGTSSPAARLHVAGSIIGSELSSNSTTDALELFAGTAFNTDGAAISLRGSASGFNNNGMEFYAGNAERMRIDSSGNLLLGGTTVLNSARQTTYSGTGVVHTCRNTSATAGKYWNIPFIDTNNTFYIINQDNVGQYMTDGATSWTANSDERLKTPLAPFENAAGKVCTLRAGTGRYLTDAADISRSFLIAQDVQAVLPEAVTVQKDKIGTLGLSYTDTIPLLVAAIQEQQAIINDLKARLDAANL